MITGCKLAFHRDFTDRSLHGKVHCTRTDSVFVGYVIDFTSTDRQVR